MSPVPGGVVALGGGHGLAQVLRALRLLDVEPTAVVTAADDGGSSGRLRREFGGIGVGDLRMALLALARKRDLARLLAHRFDRGDLRGHALGNLALVAHVEEAGGDWRAALRGMEELLDCAGAVYPATEQPVRLGAVVAGARVDGQARVAKAQGRVEEIWLDPPRPPAMPLAVAAVSHADLVLLGPGSLFTSVIATLLVTDLVTALSASSATVIYVANICTQPGETAGMGIAAHVDALFRHVDGLRLDGVLLHDGPRGCGPATPLGAVVDDPRAGRVLRADLVARDGRERPGAAHDPARLAAALAPLVTRRPVSGGQDR